MTHSRPRSRWPAAGLAAFLAVALGIGATWQVSASVGTTESTFVPVTPARILDTRDPVNLGLDGPFVSPTPQNLPITGSVPTADGTTTVVPHGASGVTLNVTVVGATAAGFISIRPAGTPGPPTTSSLNFEAGQTTPNAVTVSLPTSGAGAGAIEITYDAYGQTGPITDILIDVLGYTTTDGIQAIVADLALKANATDVYTKNQTDQAFVAHGEVVVANGNGFVPYPSNPPTYLRFFPSRTGVSGDGVVQKDLVGPVGVAGVEYGLVSFDYCITGVDEPSPGASVGLIEVSSDHATGFVTYDDTVRTVEGCYTVDVGHSEGSSYTFAIVIAGGEATRLSLSGVRSTWAPADTMN